MRDLNEDISNSWHLYHENKISNGQIYNGCMLNSLNQCSVYDKDILKRKILEHEAIFRKQVHELHRLYKIQKELMQELLQNGSNRCSKWEINSNAWSSRPDIRTQGCTKIWQTSHCLRTCINKRSDIQLPAVYIDCERSEITEKDFDGSSSMTTVPYSRDSKLYPNGEVKLSLVNISSANGWKGTDNLDSGSKNGFSHGLGDLNEPIEGQTSFVQTVSSFPLQIFESERQLKENHKHNVPLRETKSLLESTLSKDKDFGKRASGREESSNIFSNDRKEKDTESIKKSPGCAIGAASLLDINIASSPMALSSPAPLETMSPFDRITNKLSRADESFPAVLGQLKKVRRNTGRSSMQAREGEPLNDDGSLKEVLGSIPEKFLSDKNVHNTEYEVERFCMIDWGEDEGDCRDKDVLHYIATALT
ncbi:hypothetical protein HPP92_016944 [Vanilla planifolia]|uniref:Uncharacterized protein n=1 Tax=Vanilla planifolia TaxID=51239 RepID=A0A835QPP6_VANPL|nr:hypothetical protein HPP92_016944 [Vanilla planifolia]